MNSNLRKTLLQLIVVLCATTLPWLACTDFNTKGEPREAVVAQTMIAQHNWILPTNNGGEIAYKPPFFHWCVAVSSLPLGDVCEWTARFPSALAAILMLVWMFVFYARRRDVRTALLATVMCFTTFEVYRAAYACRVDMVLTLGIVGALFAFARWTELQRRGIPWLAILMMSIGTLTKGPVAMVLPCAVTGAYLLIRGENFFRAFFSMALSGLASLVLPACWYYAAYQHGGQHFLDLVLEENVGRFLGKMTYASHEGPAIYNVVILLAGLLPWTLALICQVVKNRPCVKQFFSMDFLRSVPERLRQMDTTTLFSLLSFVIIFVFYCIPKSKRGVYLLPVYPFAAWFMAVYLRSWTDKVWRRLTVGALAVWTLAFAVVLPLVVNKRSDLDIARYIEEHHMQDSLTSHVPGGAPNNPNHFFTINYYLHDAVGVWDVGGNNPAQGYLLITDRDVEQFRQDFPSVELREVYVSTHKSCDTRGIVHLMHYTYK